ncbi:MAG TPA: hypothetical protein VMW91_00615, partial [Desulfosporosinus sp.]|nr:hypothetical protein [Desulfosporosinus sp.]
PDQDSTLKYPTKLLIYNYRSQSYAFFDDCFTALGTWQSFVDKTWEQFNLDTDTWENHHETWNSFIDQALFPTIVAGNQQGFVFQLLPDFGGDDHSLCVTGMTAANPCVVTSDNYNLVDFSFILLKNVQGLTKVSGDPINNQIYMVRRVDDNTFRLLDIEGNSFATTGLYVPYSAEITPIRNYKIRTKKFNPFIEEGQSVRFGYIDWFLNSTPSGQCTVNLYQDEVNREKPPSVSKIVAFDAINQDKVWTRMYALLQAQFVQFEITLSPEQLQDEKIRLANFELNAFILWTQKGGRLISGRSSR